MDWLRDHIVKAIILAALSASAVAYLKGVFDEIVDDVLPKELKSPVLDGRVAERWPFLQPEATPTWLGETRHNCLFAEMQNMARGITSIVRTAVVAGAIGFGAGVYLVPNEKADQFRAIVQGGLGAIDRVVHSDKANPDIHPSESSQTKAPAKTSRTETQPDVPAGSQGWIGVQIQPVTTEIADSLGLRSNKGALVAEAQQNSPASAAGIKSGDVILGIDGERIDGPRDLTRKVAALGPGKKVDLIYWRDGSEKTTSVKLGSLPDDKEARARPDASQDNNAFSGLGLTLAPASSVQGAGSDGVVVSDVDPDGIAAQKGLQIGDVILEAGDLVVNQPADISAALAEAKKDNRKAVLLRVKGSEGTHFVAIEVKHAS